MSKASTKKSWKVSAAQVTATAAIVTSIVALAVSIYETRIMRSWQQASTQPIVEIQLETAPLATPVIIDIYLKNMGQGTAYVQGIKATYEDEIIEFKTLPQYWPGQNAEGVKKSETRPYRGYLGPNDSKHPISINWTPKVEDAQPLSLGHLQELYSKIEKTEISVCYCSVFERCWISDFKSQSRVKLTPVCPADYT